MIHIEHHPSHRQLAVFGLLWLAFFGFLGGTSWWKNGFVFQTDAFWTVGTVIPIAGLIWPEVLRIVYLVATYATLPIGLVLSYAILMVIYYFVVTPIGLIMRLMGYDPMQRRFDRTAKTYWTPREQEDKPERYFQQF
jgi:hypothetical protein